MSAALQALQVSVQRGSRNVLQDVSCQIRPGRVLGVLGANGAGKSTLLAALAGELPVQSGQVWLDDLLVKQSNALVQARRRAVLPQHASLGFPLAVKAVVEMGAYPFPEWSPAQLNAVVWQALVTAGLDAMAQRPYSDLSGGEQQRTQFARVWVQVVAGAQQHGHAYLLMDEPVSSLDPKHQQTILAAAHQLSRQSRVGVLTVLHDLNLAARWCDELLLLHEGGVLAMGTPQQVLKPEFLRQAYGVLPVVTTHPVDAQRPLVLFD